MLMIVSLVVRRLTDKDDHLSYVTRIIIVR